MVAAQYSDLGASRPEASAGVGGFVLFGQPSAGDGPTVRSGISALANAASAAGRAIPWMSTDDEGGPVQRLVNLIGSMPSARQMAAQWTPAQVQSELEAKGRAMRSFGITMDLAPVIDTSPAGNPVADEGDRAFSNDPNAVAAYGIAYQAGLRAGGVVPVAKHFPGLGHASANTDTGPSTDPTFAQLQSDDLIPFQRAVAAGVPVVMVGHMSVPGLTNGQPASLSSPAYAYLRQNLHFAGVTMTDDLNAGAISSAGYTQPQAAVRALEAGADMAMIDAAQWSATVSAIGQAVQSGALPLTRVQASVARILSAKSVPICPTVALVPAPQGGYWLAGSDGTVRNYGPAGDHGAVAGVHLDRPVVGMAATPDGGGYWLVASDGGVFAFGDARFQGSTGGINLARPVVGMAATPDGRGYWLVASDGGIFAFGDARFAGSTGGINLARPVVGMAPTPDGRGYWLVASDGGIFAFGDARFKGSTGGIALTRPVVGMAPTPAGGGYWLVASDGGIFAFGDARFKGSTGGIPLARPIVAMAATPDGGGYWLVASDGGVFTFGDARFYGSGA